MVSSTLCPAVHILGSQNVYSRAEVIADNYWPWAVFFPLSSYSSSFSSLFLLFLGSPTVNDQSPVLVRHCSFELSMGGVVFEHVHHVVDRNEWIIDSNDLRKE